MNTLKIGNKTFELGKKTIIMGILNVTPDSFSDGGRYIDIDDAINHGLKMEREGADIIDIGGESTRPGALKVNLEEELDRISPVVDDLVKKLKIPISIDTYKSEVAKKTLDLGASMINDITAFQGDKKLVTIVASYNVPVCLMHMKGNPRNMQTNPEYDDIVTEVIQFLKERSDYAKFCDVRPENIIIDPGLGFGKRTGRGIEDNLEIIKRLGEFKQLNYPILIGASRKTFIGNIYGKEKTLPASERLEGSLEIASLSVKNGADILRVHDVKETKEFIDQVDKTFR